MKFKMPIILLSLALVVFASGCLGLNPEDLAKTNSIVQQFLAENPNAEITVTHFTAAQANQSIDEIREVCGNSLIEPKEFYRVIVEDPEKDLPG